MYEPLKTVDKANLKPEALKSVHRDNPPRCHWPDSRHYFNG